MLNSLTVGVEEYFHPTEVQGWTNPGEWGSLPSRVEPETRFLLDLFAAHKIKGTFFVLGWVADHHPELIREIAAQGHEVGCHSYYHRLVYELTPIEFREDTRRAVKAIEDVCGVTPQAYHAPSYSITVRSFWALEVLAECGFTHDSSIYPIAHDRYGIPGFSRHAHPIPTASGSIHEVPIATVQLSPTRIAPVGGGAYLRLMPYRYTAAGIRRLNAVEHKPACIYTHPWEIDRDVPRLARGFVSRITYTGLTSMPSKFTRLLRDFQFSTLTEVHPAQAPVDEMTPCR